ncbi:uncharacterized protein LOC131621759 [Vicia villosa]|uniref:uncharacterized protein LOC131621759 n=1 Tax=Vicia villosa TaxID=3911 RepID=UPI00273BA104|nr:uncharacterized protein LOC131621759 [Vicia villosa]
MFIAKGLVSIIVIIVLILPQISAQAFSPTDSAEDNAKEQIRQKDNTIRVDPLENFQKYRGGFNITNKNYWSSLIFTGVYGYAIGMLFLLCGILYGVFLVIAKFCSRENDGEGKRMKKAFPCNYKTCDVSLILLALFLMLIAIVATGLVLVGSARFHSEAKISVDIIIKTANKALETIHNTTEALKGMENSLMEANVSIEASSNLDSTAEKLDDASGNIEMQARKNRRLINKGLKIVFVTTTVIMCLNLLAVTVLSVCGVLRLRRSLYMLVAFCWLMTVLCWLFFGVYFFIEKFSSDACIALDNFQENPYNNSLSSILPCQELLKAKPVLSEFSSGIYHLVNEVNTNLSMQATSYPNPVHVCNPFSEPPNYFYQPENCPENTIRIGDIPKVLKPFTCLDANVVTCENGNLIPNSEYARVETYTNSIQDLLNVYPSMEHLLECQIVKDAFSQVLVHHCKPMEKYAKMAWVGMVFLGVIMVLLILLWTMKARYEHCYHVSDGSVEPHFEVPNSLKSRVDKDKEIEI